jgi:hypothetical protein
MQNRMTVSDRWRPITVRDVQAALGAGADGEGLWRDHVATALGVTDRELELLISEPRTLDMAAYAYLAEFDLEGVPGERLDGS